MRVTSSRRAACRAPQTAAAAAKGKVERPGCFGPYRRMAENNGVTRTSQRALARRRLGEINLAAGRLAQLVERLLYTQDVGGSNPSPPTNDSTASPAKLVSGSLRNAPGGQCRGWTSVPTTPEAIEGREAIFWVTGPLD